MAEPVQACEGPVKSDDQGTIIVAVELARRILSNYVEPGPQDAKQTVNRLLAVLDNDDVVMAFGRLNRRRAIRLVE